MHKFKISKLCPGFPYAVVLPFCFKSIQIKITSRHPRHHAHRCNITVTLQRLLKDVHVAINVAIVQRYFQSLFLVVAKLFILHIAHLPGNNDGARDKEDRNTKLYDH